MDSIVNFFKKPSQPIINLNRSPESKALSEQIDKLKISISKSYDQDIFRDECKKLLTNSNHSATVQPANVSSDTKLAAQQWENNAKCRLADLALELQLDMHTHQADIIWGVLDEHFSKSGFFFKQYYSDPQGLKGLADQEDCYIAAYLHGMNLYNGADSESDTKKKDQIKEQAYAYLKKSTEGGCQLAFSFFQLKHFSQNTKSDFNSPIRPGCKSLVQPDTYITKAKFFFDSKDFINAIKELQRAASLQQITIVEMANNFVSKKDIEKGLLCYEIAAKSGNQEAQFRCMSIKAEQGDSEQRFQLAKRYFFGGDGNKFPAIDLQAGSKCLTLAVSQKNTGATFMLAEMYLNCFLRSQGWPTSSTSHNLDVPTKTPNELTYKYLEICEKAGHEDAKHVMKIWRETSGDKQQICIVWAAACDNKAAQFVLQKAKADQGDAKAMMMVGEFYRDGGPGGKHPEQNTPLAIEYFKKAVENGNQNAALPLNKLLNPVSQPLIQELPAENLNIAQPGSDDVIQELELVNETNDNQSDTTNEAKLQEIVQKDDVNNPEPIPTSNDVAQLTIEPELAATNTKDETYADERIIEETAKQTTEPPLEQQGLQSENKPEELIPAFTDLVSQTLETDSIQITEQIEERPFEDVATQAQDQQTEQQENTSEEPSLTFTDLAQQTIETGSAQVDTEDQSHLNEQTFDEKATQIKEQTVEQQELQQENHHETVLTLTGDEPRTFASESMQLDEQVKDHPLEDATKQLDNQQVEQQSENTSDESELTFNDGIQPTIEAEKNYGDDQSETDAKEQALEEITKQLDDQQFEQNKNISEEPIATSTDLTQPTSEVETTRINAQVETRDNNQTLEEVTTQLDDQQTELHGNTPEELEPTSPSLTQQTVEAETTRVDNHDESHDNDQTREEGKQLDEQQIEQKTQQEINLEPISTLTDLPQQTIEIASTQIVTPNETAAINQPIDEINKQSEIQQIDQQEETQENNLELPRTDIEPGETVEKINEQSNATKIDQPGTTELKDSEPLSIPVTFAQQTITTEPTQVVPQHDTHVTDQTTGKINTQRETQQIDQPQTTVEQETRENDNFNLPPVLNNLFLENTAPVTKTENMPPVQQNNKPELQPTPVASSQQIVNVSTEATKQIDEKREDATGNSTYIYILLLLAVPITTVMAYKYYQRKS